MMTRMKSIALQWLTGSGVAFFAFAIAGPIWPEALFRSPPDFHDWVIATIFLTGAIAPLAFWALSASALFESRPSQGRNQSAMGD